MSSARTRPQTQASSTLVFPDHRVGTLRGSHCCIRLLPVGLRDHVRKRQDNSVADGSHVVYSIIGAYYAAYKGDVWVVVV